MFYLLLLFSVHECFVYFCFSVFMNVMFTSVIQCSWIFCLLLCFSVHECFVYFCYSVFMNVLFTSVIQRSWMFCLLLCFSVHECFVYFCFSVFMNVLFTSVIQCSWIFCLLDSSTFMNVSFRDPFKDERHNNAPVVRKRQNYLMFQIEKKVQDL